MMINESDINWGFRAHDIGRAPVRELAGKIADMGFHHIQLALKKAVTGVDASFGSLSPIASEFGKKDIRVSVLGCYINPVHPDRLVRKDHLDRFIEHLTYARDFGCSIVGTETGSPRQGLDPAWEKSHGPLKDIYHEDTFKLFLESLEILVAAAEKTGTIVAIEGVADKDSIHSHERMMRTLEHIPSPGLGVIYDPVNFLPFARSSECDKLMEEAFALFGHRMVAIHAKDYILEEDRVNTAIPSGRGLLNYPLLLELIRKHKPMIPVLLENNSPDTVEETIEFINSLGGTTLL